MTTQRIPSHIQDSLRRVLDYLWDDERVDHTKASSPNDRTERHIFDDLVELRIWSESSSSD